MRDLALILLHTNVISLVNAKPIRKKNFIYLHQEDSIRDALSSFIIHDIASIPICRSKLEGNKCDDFIGIISLVNLLKFIYSKKCSELSIEELLGLQLTFIAQREELIQKIEFIQPDASLLHLLLNVWCGNCNPKTTHTDCKHLLTATESGKYEVITPLDFLRHLLFFDDKAVACLKNSQAADIENGFDIDENLIICWGEDVKVAMERIIQSEPNYIVAVVDDQNGKLEANISFSDILPNQKDLLDESVSLIRSDGISIKSYLMAMNLKNYSIEPLLLHENYSIFDLIQKMTKLSINSLWRVTADSNQKPLGGVGITDILRYLSYMFVPFCGNLDQDFSYTNSMIKS